MERQAAESGAKEAEDEEANPNIFPGRSLCQMLQSRTPGGCGMDEVAVVDGLIECVKMIVYYSGMSSTK